MDPFVDEMSEAYKNLADAAAAVIEARVAAGGDGGEVPRTAACDAALEELKERLELFRASCDRAEGAIDEAKRRAECELFFPAMGDGELSFPAMGDGELSFPAMGDGELFVPAMGDGELSFPAMGDGELFFPAMGDGELFFPAMGDGELFFPAMGDGVGEADGPFAARENAVGDDDDIPSLTEMPDAGFVEAAPAMEKEAVDVPMAAEAEGSAATENVVVCDIDTQKIIDAWVTFLS